MRDSILLAYGKNVGGTEMVFTIQGPAYFGGQHALLSKLIIYELSLGLEIELDFQKYILKQMFMQRKAPPKVKRQQM